jgi:hypothetical protein
MPSLPTETGIPFFLRFGHSALRQLDRGKSSSAHNAQRPVTGKRPQPKPLAAGVQENDWIVAKGILRRTAFGASETIHPTRGRPSRQDRLEPQTRHGSQNPHAQPHDPEAARVQTEQAMKLR